MPAAPQQALLLPGFGRWAAASFVDVVIGAAAVAGAVAGALGARGVRVAVQPIVDFLAADPVAGVVTFLAPALVALSMWQLVCLLALGGTLGQRLLGLRVARAHDGAKPGVLRAFVRAIASAVGVIAFGAGPLWALWMDRRRRGLGDLVARTLVVRRSSRQSQGARA